MVIQHNIAAMNSNRILGTVSRKQTKASEKLSSGFQINRAADDAAGLSISEKMRSLIRGLDRGADNVQEGISLIQTADGALDEVVNSLQRVRELSIAAYNETNSQSDIDAMQAEVDQILTEIGRIGETTTYNEKKIFQDPELYIAYTIPAKVETYTEEVIGERKLPDWLWNNSDKEMATRLDENNQLKSPYKEYTLNAADAGIMYKTIYDATAGKDVLIYYGNNEIDNPENGAIWAGDYYNDTDEAKWSTSLADKACANLTFEGLTQKGSNEELYDALVDLLGSQLAYPCGTCGDSRSCVKFVGEASDLPFYVNAGSGVVPDGETADKVKDVDLSKRNFEFSYANGTIKQETSGYFDAIKNLMKRHSEVTLTDDQKTTEVQNLAKAIAKDLTKSVYNALKDTSEGHFDRVVMDDSVSEYAMVIYDYRDVDKLSSEEAALAPVLSQQEGYVIWKEQRERTIDAIDVYAEVKTRIISSTEHRNSIEITLPKITLEELAIKDYKLGTQYDIEYMYEYGSDCYKMLEDAENQYVLAMKQYEDAMEQYEEDMAEYEEDMAEYNTKYLKWCQEHVKTREVEVPNVVYDTKVTWKDGHRTEEIVSKVAGTKKVTEYYYDGVFTEPKPTEPTKPVEPTVPQITDFQAHAEKKIKSKTLREDTLDPIDNAIDSVLKARAVLGAQQNRLEHVYNINKNTHENTSAAESRIRDTNMADAMVEFSKNNILMQAGQSMLAQANQSTQGVLSLLQ